MAHPFRRLVRLGIPLGLAQLGVTAMGLVDTWVVGRASAADLAGMGVAAGVFFTVSLFGMGIVMGAEPFMAQAMGAGQREVAFAIYRRTVRIAFVLGVPGALLVAGLGLGIEAFVDNPRVGHEAKVYIWGRAPGLFFLLWTIAQKAYLQTLHLTRPVVISVVLANLLNLGLDWVLVLGDEGLSSLGLPALGLPALGALGAGVSSSVVTMVQVAVLVWAMRLLTEKPPSAPSPSSRAIVRMGLPIGAQYALEVGIFTAAAFMMVEFGEDAAAAHQIALSLVSVTFSFILGMSSAATVLIGNAVGAEDRAGTLRVGLVCLTTAAGVMACSALGLAVFRQSLAAFFTEDAGVVHLAAQLMIVAAIFQVGDGIQAMAGGVLRGAGDSHWAFGLNLLSHWGVGFPVALVAAFVLDHGPLGVWAGLACGLCTAGVTQAVRFFTAARRGYARASMSA